MQRLFAQSDDTQRGSVGILKQGGGGEAGREWRERGREWMDGGVEIGEQHRVTEHFQV